MFSFPGRILLRAFPVLLFPLFASGDDPLSPTKNSRYQDELQRALDAHCPLLSDVATQLTPRELEAEMEKAMDRLLALEGR